MRRREFPGILPAWLEAGWMPSGPPVQLLGLFDSGTNLLKALLERNWGDLEARCGEERGGEAEAFRLETGSGAEE